MWEMLHTHFMEILVLAGLAVWMLIVFIRYKKNKEREQRETEELLKLDANRAANKAKRERKKLKL